ncbi:MAG: peptidylprolyl isomerase [bacterium]|nr:peptidylprolyl isomerase [bacterium]
MTAKKAIGIFFLIILAGTLGCRGKAGKTTCWQEREALTKPPQGGDVVASIGDEKITQKEFEYQIAQLGQASSQAAKTLPGLSSFLNSYINRKLILQEIAGQPLDPQVERQIRLVWENAMINKYLEKTLKDRVVTEDKVKNYYQNNKKEFTAPEMIHVAQIMFNLDPQMKPEEKLAARQKAEAALKRLGQGEDFRNLARQISEDKTSAPHGGDLSYFARGHLPPAFEDAAFALKKEGEVSGIVESTMGFHIIKMLGRKAPELIPYDKVRDQLMTRLGPGNRQEAYRAYIEELRRSHEVNINSAVLMSMVTNGALKETAEKMGLQVYPPGSPNPPGGMNPAGFPGGATR